MRDFLRVSFHLSPVGPGHMSVVSISNVSEKLCDPDRNYAQWLWCSVIKRKAKYGSISLMIHEIDVTRDVIVISECTIIGRLLKRSINLAVLLFI